MFLIQFFLAQIWKIVQVIPYLMVALGVLAIAGIMMDIGSPDRMSLKHHIADTIVAGLFIAIGLWGVSALRRRDKKAGMQ
jgi:hypothetical protein